MATNDQSNKGSKQDEKSGSQQSGTSKRGFASMDPDQQREIAAEGGRAAHEKGTAHEFTSEEARRAGSMSHKNDAGSSQGSQTGQSSQSGTGSSASRSSGGSKAGAGEQDEDDDSGGRSGSRGSGSGKGSKS